MLQSTLYRLTPRSPDTPLSAATKTRQGKHFAPSPPLPRALLTLRQLSAMSHYNYEDDEVYNGPGCWRRLEDWEDTSSSATPAATTNNSNNRGGRGTSSRNTSDSTSHSGRQATTTSETRQSPENGAGSKDSDKSEEKKPKPSWCESPSKK
ncbi:uncharacterized protein NECHADRAFT_78873 [Fusarium vanettenii 77-13-4]|uniref:Uncharacterized protein n=1 Tax=Fusarium vanettenii (strain ATCC MYA-4622 / CBS 123669 / FGSC 9596 / NRRL 45880 / 77-13-4) TaxID=660122 RepID=C7YPU3_FUSV7|nr:uncharacterized protein NECHADRAFT_78873 [Fusarium vanettenii 77-13-4]EEU46352.1 predicted protein [Fusarium vanettenii 77-13-4]